MKRILPIFICMPFLVSCEREEHSAWRCVSTVVYSQPGFLPDTITNVNYYESRTHEEINNVIELQTYLGTQERNGMIVNVESKCSCAESVCQ